MKFFKLASLVSVLSTAVVLPIAMVGCDPAETFVYDYLDAKGQVTLIDGKTGVPNLDILTYDWVTHYTDGSTVLNRFTPPAFKTDSNGRFNFRSDQLGLTSGNLASECYTVCVDYDGYYEEYCTLYDIDGYCIAWDSRWVEYCSQYGQDCNYYYPSRNVGDIESAHTEISYYLGTSLVTTPSERYTYPEDAFVSSTVPVGDNDKETTMYWTQDDVYVTPLNPNGVRKTKLARKPVARRPSVVISSGDLDRLLSPEQKSNLDRVRVLWGATKK